MDVCSSCKDSLIVEVELSDNDEDVEMGGSSSATAAGNGGVTTVPDDIHLNCGCHFHWACLLDSYTHTSCPSCNRDITSTTSTSPPQIQVLCTLTNEGGTQPDLDILPLLTEESYLKAYPEDRRARAFLEFCREGDVAAVVELLQSDDVSDDDDEDDEDAMEDTTASGEKCERRQIDLLRYQDPIGDMQSALHAAVAGGSREVAWLLLLLASQLPLPEFPAIVFQEADKLGVMRGEDDMAGKADIRTLRDADGRSAEDVAKDVGVIWNGWVGNGRLAI